MLIIDKYAYTNKLKDKNPLAKFYFAIFFLILAIVSKKFYIHIAILSVMFFITITIAKIPLKKYIKMILIPSSFLVLSILAILISVSKGNGEYIISMELYNVNIGITNGSIENGRILFTRSLSAITCTFFLILTTPMNDIIYILKKHRVPKLLIEIMVLIYRFIFIFLEEYKNIYTAQQLRFGYINIKNSFKAFSALISVLFARIMLKYEHMEMALDSKGFDNEFYV